ncbi:DoxX family protein [Haloferax sp. Atlit-10N]|uniref:DoxX family protein n=1 Tax=unclassified Haloferax TaxID=2625095 RepID=UPI000E24474D|nr:MULTISPECIES: DoxX family protein [unclassified Haloferax]RDZ39583.1 DoxX family protein [Haloferax sp. Atlit-16N]RDZ53750.1 DoxX family protein [Haloferax sp. Atlit-10N]
MERTFVDCIESVRQSVPEWVPTGLRLVLIALVAKPALSKVVTYGSSVSFFDAIGMPAPALMVVVAGLIEVGAVALLLIGVGERIAAISLIPVMLVAILYVGPDWKNLSVLLGAMGLIVLMTDFDAIWHPIDRRLG